MAHVEPWSGAGRIIIEPISTTSNGLSHPTIQTPYLLLINNSTKPFLARLIRQDPPLKQPLVLQIQLRQTPAHQLREQVDALPRLQLLRLFAVVANAQGDFERLAAAVAVGEAGGGGDAEVFFDGFAFVGVAEVFSRGEDVGGVGGDDAPVVVVAV